MILKLFILYFALRSVKAEINTIDDKYDCQYCQPEQVHLSFGEQNNIIVVTWSTFNDTRESWVEFGEAHMDRSAHGSSERFVDGGRLRRAQYIHRVRLPDLNYNTSYVYHVGSKYGWSEEFFFHTPPEGTAWVVRAAIYGDMGNKNAQSVAYLQEEAQRGEYDAILHVGDFAYDMDSEEGLVGDQFMRQIQPIAAYVPYMTCVGNHEAAYDFSHYKRRFTMPQHDRFENLMYAWRAGPVTFLALNTEYYYEGLKASQLVRQYAWLQDQLREANRPENRRERPWIIVFGHRPMYCSNSDDIAECALEYTRVGLLGLYGLEKPLYEAGVDVVVWAHEHSYERTWPLYDRAVYNGSLDQPYVNPRAPIHIITGSAGCQEAKDPFVSHPAEWSAFRAYEYGYTKFWALNKTHLHFQQISAEKNGSVIDEYWIVKTKARPDFH